MICFVSPVLGIARLQQAGIRLGAQPNGQLMGRKDASLAKVLPLKYGLAHPGLGEVEHAHPALEISSWLLMFIPMELLPGLSCHHEIAPIVSNFASLRVRRKSNAIRIARHMRSGKYFDCCENCSPETDWRNYQFAKGLRFLAAKIAHAVAATCGMR